MMTADSIDGCHDKYRTTSEVRRDVPFGHQKRNNGHKRHRCRSPTDMDTYKPAGGALLNAARRMAMVSSPPEQQ
jgi:hypothetical protein